jgi:hypothetical protein
MTLEHVHDHASGLVRDVYDIDVDTRAGLRVRLVRVLRGVRPTRRHTWTTTLLWERRVGEVPRTLPDDVRAAVGRELAAQVASALEGV